MGSQNLLSACIAASAQHRFTLSPAQSGVDLVTQSFICSSVLHVGCVSASLAHLTTWLPLLLSCCVVVHAPVVCCVSYVQDYDEKNPATYKGLNLYTMPMSALYAHFGLDAQTIDFIGHALALHRYTGRGVGSAQQHAAPRHQQGLLLAQQMLAGWKASR